MNVCTWFAFVCIWRLLSTTNLFVTKQQIAEHTELFGNIIGRWWYICTVSFLPSSGQKWHKCSFKEKPVRTWMKTPELKIFGYCMKLIQCARFYFYLCLIFPPEIKSVCHSVLQSDVFLFSSAILSAFIYLFFLCCQSLTASSHAPLIHLRPSLLCFSNWVFTHLVISPPQWIQTV